MSKLTCLVLCAVIASLSSNYSSEDGPLVIEDVFVILLDCAKKHNVSDETLQEVAMTRNVTIVNPCLWGCAFKKTGFINQKGEYDLNPGLTYVRDFLKLNKDYTNLEIIVQECKSVRNYAVSDGEAGCEVGVLAAKCFLKEFEKRGI